MELAERVLCVLKDIGTKASPEEISFVAQGLQEEVLKHVHSTGKPSEFDKYVRASVKKPWC